MHACDSSPLASLVQLPWQPEARILVPPQLAVYIRRAMVGIS